MKKLDYEYCKAALLTEWMGDKWALAVLMHLHEHGTMRYNELFRTIPHISERVLASTLRQLVHDGFVNRRVYAEVPPRVEYRTTTLADSLYPILKRHERMGTATSQRNNREQTQSRRQDIKRKPIAT